MTFYAIGDVHGQLEKLIDVHTRISIDQLRHGTQSAPVVHLGDYVDRGPDVRGTLDYLVSRQERAPDDVFILGNHDRMMEAFLQPVSRPDPAREELFWLDRIIGGRSSLASYGVDVSRMRRVSKIHEEARAKVPEAHLSFLRRLRPCFAAPGLYFCHAGIRPGIPLSQQNVDDLVWIRDAFLSDTRDHGALIIHGHTPFDHVRHCGNRIGVDTGAGFGGALSVIVLEGDLVFELTDQGRVLLPPPLTAVKAGASHAF